MNLQQPQKELLFLLLQNIGDTKNKIQYGFANLGIIFLNPKNTKTIELKSLK